jgi:hypothetical protein
VSEAFKWGMVGMEDDASVARGPGDGAWGVAGRLWGSSEWAGMCSGASSFESLKISGFYGAPFAAGRGGFGRFASFYRLRTSGRGWAGCVWVGGFGARVRLM